MQTMRKCDDEVYNRFKEQVQNKSFKAANQVYTQIEDFLKD